MYFFGMPYIYIYILIDAIYIEFILRGTQREYSSKPLKHSIVKRVLVFKQWIWAYLYPL